MTNLKWQIDTIRTILFFNNKINFEKGVWSKAITGKDISNDLKQEENGIEQQYIEMTDIDHKSQFNLVFVKESNIIDLQVSFEKDNNVYSYDEIVRCIKDFSDKTKVIYQNFDNQVIRVGRVIELSIPLEDDMSSCQLLKNNIPYFSNLDDDLSELSFRVNKPSSFNKIKVNQVIHYVEGQKMQISFDPHMVRPKANVQKHLILNIDSNTDAAHRSTLDVTEISDFLEESIVSIIKNGGTYASN